MREHGGLLKVPRVHPHSRGCKRRMGLPRHRRWAGVFSAAGHAGLRRQISPAKPNDNIASAFAGGRKHAPAGGRCERGIVGHVLLALAADAS